MRIVKAKEMAAIDHDTMQKVGIPGAVLMERAGFAIFTAIVKHFGSVKGKRFLVLCGPGNNGGDGFVIARYLCEAEAEVICLSMKELDNLRGDAQLYASIYQKLYGNLHIYVDIEQIKRFLQETEYVVDALFGNGLDRNLKSPYIEIIESINEHANRLKVIAVDLPSGLEADSGQILGNAPSCQLTVTVGLPKWGLYLEPGRSRAGKVEVADIGFPKVLTEDPTKECLIVDQELAASLLPTRARNAYKGTFGTVWVIGGSDYYLGAPLLSSQAALRSGAGMVLLAAPSSLCSKIGAAYPEVMRCPLEDEGFLNEHDLEYFPWLKNDKNGMELSSHPCPWPSPKAVCLGPGLGRKAETTEAVRTLITKCPVPMVIDADALWHLSKIATAEKVDLQQKCVLTPHLGELSRLLDTDVAELEKNLPYYARLCAQKYHCIVAAKGSPTLVSDGQRCWLNSSGGPVLAQGGSGDVLAGLISGLLAQGMEPFEAAVLGVYWHGAAGDKASAEHSDRGLVASEISNLLPGVSQDFINLLGNK